VADPGCLSRIPDPDFYPSRISDPGSKNSNKRERRKKIICHTFLCSHKFHKIVNYFSFEVLKKKIWANFQRIIELFTKKIVKKLLKIWSWDPGSEIRDPEKTYSGSRIQGSKRHRIPDPVFLSFRRFLSFRMFPSFLLGQSGVHIVPALQMFRLFSHFSFPF
jgi:hypothetical protein